MYSERIACWIILLWAFLTPYSSFTYRREFCDTITISILKRIVFIINFLRFLFLLVIEHLHVIVHNLILHFLRILHSLLFNSYLILLRLFYCLFAFRFILFNYSITRRDTCPTHNTCSTIFILIIKTCHLLMRYTKNSLICVNLIFSFALIIVDSCLSNYKFSSSFVLFGLKKSLLLLDWRWRILCSIYCSRWISNWL